MPAASVLLWIGAVGAWLFVVVFTVDGWTRPGYRPSEHPVSALALGPRGWVQGANFIIGGFAIVGGAVGVGLAEDGLLLAIGIGIFGVALVASGIFPMDPMRGYPPGAPAGDPVEPSGRHRLHDAAGAVVFTSLPVVAVIAAVSAGEPWLRIWSGVTGMILALGFLAFGQAWENRSPRSGLIQRAVIIPGWVWLGAQLAHLA